uniref:Uncharacterized protein n=1 Tax=Romanomermis culicivorax TaxID=13658 RepID=A0A915K1L1_ROMCU
MVRLVRSALWVSSGGGRGDAQTFQKRKGRGIQHWCAAWFACFLSTPLRCIRLSPSILENRPQCSCTQGYGHAFYNLHKKMPTVRHTLPDHTHQNLQSSSPNVASNAVHHILNFDQQILPTILNHAQPPPPPLWFLARWEHPNTGVAQRYDCTTAKFGRIASPRPSFRYGCC